MQPQGLGAAERRLAQSLPEGARRQQAVRRQAEEVEEERWRPESVQGRRGAPRLLWEVRRPQVGPHQKQEETQRQPEGRRSPRGERRPRREAQRRRGEGRRPRGEEEVVAWRRESWSGAP